MYLLLLVVIVIVIVTGAVAVALLVPCSLFIVACWLLAVGRGRFGCGCG